MVKKSHFSGSGPSQRMLRVGELIRRTLAEVLQRDEVHDPDLNRMMITVSEVRVSPDLKIATCYVLPLGGQNKEETIKALTRNKGELRRIVTKKMEVRHSPDLRFLSDDTFDAMDDTRRLLNLDEVKRDLDG